MHVSISIIIPCYNSGKYLPDAISSVEKYTGKHAYEIIIVNDGSTDEFTLSLLDQLLQKSYTVISQENGGPAAARNTGVKHSKSELILFLDSDNKIKPEYIDESIAALNLDASVGVVYANPTFFGDINIRPEYNTRELDIKLLLASNYIDMCSVVRKNVWEQVGGLDENRVLIGHEDWDFWLSVYKTKWKFLYINKEMFEYRVREDSLTNTLVQPELHKKKVNYIYCKHVDLVREGYGLAIKDSILYNNDIQKPFRSFAKFFYKKYFESSKRNIKAISTTNG